MSNIYIDFKDFQGEATEADHDGWCEVQSFSIGCSQPGASAAGATTASGGYTSGETLWQPFTMSKFIDSSSTSLEQYLADAKVISEVVVHFMRQTEAQPYLKFTLTNVAIGDYQLSGGADQLPMESLVLYCTKQKMEYTTMEHEGTPGDTSQHTFNVATSKTE